MENMNVMNNEAIETVEETVVSSGNGLKTAGIIGAVALAGFIVYKGIKKIKAKKAKAEEGNTINVEAEVVDEFTEENDNNE